MYRHWHILKTNYINRSFLKSRKVECQESTEWEKLKVRKQKALHQVFTELADPVPTRRSVRGSERVCTGAHRHGQFVAVKTWDKQVRSLANGFVFWRP